MIARSLLALLLVLGCVGCVEQAPPAPAVLREVAPPWPAVRDGVSQFELAGVVSSRLDDTTNQWVVGLTIAIDGVSVPVAADIGVDLPRALQAPVHTHDDSGQLWLEGAGAETVTLGQFFMVWGVRFTEECLGAACGNLTVRADGVAVTTPSGLVLHGAEQVEVNLLTG